MTPVVVTDDVVTTTTVEVGAVVVSEDTIVREVEPVEDSADVDAKDVVVGIEVDISVFVEDLRVNDVFGLVITVC